MVDAVLSYPYVSGTVGQAVTLPCTYTGAITSMCWGRGACPTSWCSNEIVSTDGFTVTFQENSRYKLMGSLSERNVSLTIENAVKTDSGLYCCRVEHRGWFNDQKITLSLEIKADQFEYYGCDNCDAYLQMKGNREMVYDCTSSSFDGIIPAANTQLKTSQETKAQPTSSPWHCCPTDGNGTVTQSSDGLWHNNQTDLILEQKTWRTSTKGLYIGVGIFVAVLLSLLVILVVKISFNGPQIGALRGATEERIRAEDNVYIIEENVYVVD
ncbi:hepatitis A virus cellular receptor 1-like [Rhynchocyon petersi]